jgi:citrate lyase subunit beta/citryl-CoA lyase
MILRSLLFVPGDRPDRMQKAAAAGADALILDLEDAVAPARKAAAREAVADFLQHGACAQPVFVRVNPQGTAAHALDLDAITALRPDGIVLPKAEGAAAVLKVVREFEAAGVEAPGILPIATETALAVFRLGEYADVARHLLGITWGAEDLGAAVGATASRTPDGRWTAPFETVRSLTLFAAHAAGAAAIDTLYAAHQDLDGLALQAATAARDGFTGMLAIHPKQVPLINAAFTPGAAAVERARRIVAAFAVDPAAGVLSLDGNMIDAPHLKQAEALLARVAARK